MATGAVFVRTAEENAWLARSCSAVSTSSSLAHRAGSPHCCLKLRNGWNRVSSPVRAITQLKCSQGLESPRHPKGLPGSWVVSDACLSGTPTVRRRSPYRVRWVSVIFQRALCGSAD